MECFQTNINRFLPERTFHFIAVAYNIFQAFNQRLKKVSQKIVNAPQQCFSFINLTWPIPCPPSPSTNEYLVKPCKKYDPKYGMAWESIHNSWKLWLVSPYGLHILGPHSLKSAFDTFMYPTIVSEQNMSHKCITRSWDAELYLVRFPYLCVVLGNLTGCTSGSRLLLNIFFPTVSKVWEVVNQKVTCKHRSKFHQCGALIAQPF